jgi:hypothetical protein
MKKLAVTVFALLTLAFSFGQRKTKTTKELLNQPGDHVMVQLATDHWSGTPDSIGGRMKSLGRGANVYVMLNKPFKTNPKLSLAFGVGVGTSNVYFKRTNVDIAANGTKLPFINLDSSDRFKKYKLTTAFLEVPLEFRFTAKPENEKKSMKFALGIKVGTLLSASTKGKNLENKAGNVIGSYTEKVKDKTFFNTTRFAATARVGYGHFSLFGSYQFNNIFKDGAAAEIKPFQIGLAISGL